MNFSIPIVFRIKADTVEEAEDIAMKLVRYGVEPCYEDAPTVHEALKYYGPANIMLRVRK